MRKPRDFTEKERYARYRWFALILPLFAVIGLAVGLIGGRWDWSAVAVGGVWLLVLLSNASLAFDDRRRRLDSGRGLWLEDQPGDVLAERDELRRRLDIALAQLETVPTASAGLKVLIPFHLRRIDNAVSVIKNGELPDPTHPPHLAVRTQESAEAYRNRMQRDAPDSSHRPNTPWVDSDLIGPGDPG